MSNASDGGNRRLALVFFDVLLLDGVSLLSLSYAERRAILEQVISLKPGYAMVAERTCIDMKNSDGEDTLRRTFARVIADHQEGMVIKADGAMYAERRWPWVKVRLVLATVIVDTDAPCFATVEARLHSRAWGYRRSRPARGLLGERPSKRATR